MCRPMTRTCRNPSTISSSPGGSSLGSRRRPTTYGDVGVEVHAADVSVETAARTGDVGSGNESLQKGPLTPVDVLQLNISTSGAVI